MAKTMFCTAFLDNDAQVDNLCQCIKILGGEPVVSKNTVKVAVPYPSNLACHILLLCENYWRHEITISDK